MRRTLGTAVAAALVMSGCASGAGPDLGPGAAAQLQAAVLDVSTASAQGRYDAARAALDDLHEALTEAAEAGEVSVARYAAISDAVRRVEAELALMTDEAPGLDERRTAAPTPSPTASATPTEASRTTSSSSTGGTSSSDAGSKAKDSPKKKDQPKKGPKDKGEKPDKGPGKKKPPKGPGKGPGKGGG